MKASKVAGLGPLDAACAVGFLAYASGATITPICLVILARELSFSLTAAGGLELARSLLVLATLLASGALAGRFGKVRSLGWSCVLLGGGLAAYAAAPDYGFILLAIALVGGGGGVVEALINPLVQDLHPKDSGRYLNLVNAFWSVGVLGTMLVGGEALAQGVSWRVLLGALSALSLASGALYLLLRRHEPAGGQADLLTALSHKRGVLTDPAFPAFGAMMFLAGAAEGGLTFWSATLVQLQFETSPRAGGFGAALFALGMIVGRLALAAWVRQHHLHRALLLSTLAALAASVLIPHMNQLVPLFALFFFAGLGVAGLWPSLQSHAADRMMVDTTALFILLSCAGIPGFAFASWLMGWLSERFDVATAFNAVPASLLLLALLLHLKGPTRNPACIQS